MIEKNKTDDFSGSLETELVLSSLESSQLTEAKKPFPRRNLGPSQTLVLWIMRIYVLFMMAVVIYQIWSGAGN
ncbi:MAG TPA: hypothetical protein VHA33_10875 [Candidatus Angelobacter sp.]|jgi:hypothetical protein|nr:hypothetical protein [Candidatus Angelobacter sp.]